MENFFFMQCHLHYSDVIYVQPINERWCQAIESVQYKSALAITRAIKGTSQANLYKDLGLETLTDEMMEA